MRNVDQLHIIPACCVCLSLSVYVILTLFFFTSSSSAQHIYTACWRVCMFRRRVAANSSNRPTTSDLYSWPQLLSVPQKKRRKKVGPTKKLVYACISKLYLLSLIPQSRLYDIVVSRLNGHRRCWQSTTGRIALWTSLGVWHLRWRIGLAIKRFERRRRQRAKEEYWFSIGKILFLSSL